MRSKWRQTHPADDLEAIYPQLTHGTRELPLSNVNMSTTSKLEEHGMKDSTLENTANKDSRYDGGTEAPIIQQTSDRYDKRCTTVSPC
jgi:hypothetical protein